MQNILESYLVSLGFSVSTPEFQKFQDTLKRTSTIVELYSKSTGLQLGKFAGDIVKWQTAILGGFTSISGAILGVANNAAEQDQKWRLLGMRIFVTGQSARKLSMIMETLNQPMENLIWDKELHQRALMLGADIDRYTKQLGPNFEANMKGIRDITAQLGRARLAVKLLGMEFASSLFNKLGIDEPAIARWIDKFGNDLPRISDELANNAVPVLKDTWEMLQRSSDALKEFGLLFQNVVGQLSGDKSLQGTTMNFETMATAIQHVIEVLKNAFEKITVGEVQLSHLTRGLILLSERKLVAAKAEFDAADEPNRLQAARDAAAAAEAKRPGSTPMSIALASAGATLPPPPPPGAGARKLDPTKPINFWDLEQGDWGYDTFRRRFPGIAGWVERHAKQGSRWADISNQVSRPSQDISDVSYLADLQHRLGNQRELVDKAITALATQMGINPALARAQAFQESGERQYEPSGKIKTGKAGEIGIMQLRPPTAADMGVDPNDPTQNIIGGLRYLRQLLAKYNNDVKLALEAYNWGPTNLDRALKMHLAINPNVEQYASDIMARANYSMAANVPAPQVTTTTIDVGGITVHVAGDLRNMEELKEAVTSAVTKGITNSVNKQTQRTIAQAGGGH